MATPKKALLETLRLPIRWRLLEIFNEHDRLSPVQIVHGQLAADIESMKGKSHRDQLSHVSYHCNQLRKAGLLEIADEQAVRGATEHFFRASGQAFFSDDEWAELSLREREDITASMLSSFFARAEEARRAGTYDARVNRWLAWLPLELDERGWDEMTTSVAACYAEISAISEESAKRLKGSNEKPIRATYGIFTFESPTPGAASNSQKRSDRGNDG